MFERGVAYADNGDATKAVFCYRRAADAGHPGAQGELGWCYQQGIGGVGLPNRAQATMWYERAAGNGDVESMYRLGMGYLDTDPSRAVHFLRLAADQWGHALAQHQLGHLHFAGTGAPRDMHAAARYYERAAAQGVAGAQYDLGACYSVGAGVPLDSARALHYLELAAGQGDRMAQCQLAWMYEGGEDGVPRDSARAAHHFRQAVAADEGDEVQRNAFGFACRRLAGSRDFASTCCLGCGATRRLKTCDRCHVARFCSIECITRTWPVHQPHCRRWR